jgi:hypothetical protein
MANYGVFYFGLAPILCSLNLPRGSSRPQSSSSPLFTWKQPLFALAALVLGVTVPYYQPSWFHNTFQFLSEVSGPPLIGEDGNRHALVTHLFQLLASSLILVFCLEAVPRRPTFLSTLGDGTFSCFILHWWLRPIWLSALTRLLAFSAPMLQECSSDTTEHATAILFSGLILGVIFIAFLLLVQYSISGIWIHFGNSVDVKEDTRFELRFPLKWHNVRKYVSLKVEYVVATMKGRGSSIMFSLMKIGGHLCMWLFLASALLREKDRTNLPGKGSIYLGGKCAAVVIHSSLTKVGVSSHLPVYRPTEPVKPLSEGGGVCLLMNGGVPFKLSLCDNMHKLEGNMLAACLNR